jgi:hypothetical protein
VVRMGLQRSDGHTKTDARHYWSHRRQRWAMISRILTRQGSTPKVMGYFYKAICQAVLLYGCETWVVTQAICNKLESFHNHVARQISRYTIRLDHNTGEWIYPPLEIALNTSGLFPLQHYLEKRRSYLLQHARNCPLLHESQQIGRGVGGSQHHYWFSYISNDLEV